MIFTITPIFVNMTDIEPTVLLIFFFFHKNLFLEMLKTKIVLLADSYFYVNKTIRVNHMKKRFNDFRIFTENPLVTENKPHMWGINCALTFILKCWPNNFYIQPGSQLHQYKLYLWVELLERQTRFRKFRKNHNRKFPKTHKTNVLFIHNFLRKTYAVVFSCIFTNTIDIFALLNEATFYLLV